MINERKAREKHTPLGLACEHPHRSVLSPIGLFAVGAFIKSSPTTLETFAHVGWLAGSDHRGSHFTPRTIEREDPDVTNTTPNADGGGLTHAHEASHESVIKRVLNWLTDRYPRGVPPTERYALIALLHRSLTAEEVQQVIAPSRPSSPQHSRMG
jgi:Protein of unknown function (DUF3349)